MCNENTKQPVDTSLLVENHKYFSSKLTDKT